MSHRPTQFNAFPVTNPFGPRAVLGVVLRALGVRFADGEGARAAAREVGPAGQHLQTFDAALGALVGVAAIPLEEGERGAGLCGQFGDDDFLDIQIWRHLAGYETIFS